MCSVALRLKEQGRNMMSVEVEGLHIKLVLVTKAKLHAEAKKKDKESDIVFCEAIIICHKLLEELVSRDALTDVVAPAAQPRQSALGLDTPVVCIEQAGWPAGLAVSMPSKDELHVHVVDVNAHLDGLDLHAYLR